MHAAGEQRCNDHGARLLRPRSTMPLWHLDKGRREYFGSNAQYMYSWDDHITAIDLWFGPETNTSNTRKFFYLDNTLVDPNVVDTLEWADNYPTADMDHNCIALKETKIMNVPCDDPTYFSDINIAMTDGKPTMGYICEVRLIEDKFGSGKTCHFPFIYQQTSFSSCSNYPVAGFNPDGMPWCATEVTQSTGIVKPNKWILCEDEREIIYDGSGADFFCPMPFVFNRVYYDYCSRKNTDVFAGGFNSYYWCPDPAFVEDDTNTYRHPVQPPIGKCPEYLYPPGNIVSYNFTTFLVKQYFFS